MQDNYKIFIGTSVHRWNDNRIFHKEAVSLAKKFNVELHAPADFDKKNIYEQYFKKDTELLEKLIDRKMNWF